MFQNRVYLHQQIFFCLLVLIAITFPFTILINSYFIILLIVNWLLEANFGQKFSRLLSNKLALLSLGFYILHIIGMLYTSDVKAGFSDMETKLSLFLFPLIVGSSEPLSKKQFEALLKWFVVACVGAIVICFSYAFYQYLFFQTTEYFYYHNLGKVIKIHAIYLAMYLNFAIGIIIYFLNRDWNKLPAKIKLWLMSIIILFSVGIFFLASKIIIICFFIFCNVFLARLFFIKKGLAVSAFFTASINIIIIVLLINIPYTRERFLQEKDLDFDFIEKNEYDREYTGFVLRVVMWKFSVEILNAERGWIFGVGTGDGQKLLNQSYKNHGMYTGNINFSDRGYMGYNTHNQYIQFLLSLGITGLMYFLLILFLSGIQALDQKNYLYLYFLLLFAISSISEANLCTQKGIVFYALFHTLFFTGYKKNQ